METEHVLIPIGLRQDTCCRYGHIGSIAVYDRVCGYLQQFAFRHVRFPFIAVHEYMLRSDGQFVQGSLHSQDGALKDVSFVNLLRRHFDHCPRERFSLDDRTQGFALFLGQLLGVVEPRELRNLLHPLRIKDHRCAEHAAR